MSPQETLKQVESLTSALIKLSLSNAQNFPTTRGEPDRNYEITVSNAAKMTLALKNVAYSEIYRELDSEKCFNFKMLDGALVVLRYRFISGQISEHSLSFFPSPDLDEFQNNPELYLLDEVYADVIARNIVPFPIRFDYCNDQAKFVEIHHPYSHLTLGQYENCRIPVNSPLCPLAFGGFILRNFYNTAFRKYSEEIPVSIRSFRKTITSSEQRIPHFVCGG
jgi:hypothetical protein